MAHDLIFGRTTRDWSCGGAAPATPAPGLPWDRLPPAPAVAEATRAEMSKAAAAAIRLRRRGLLPDADWRGFGQLHRRWVTFSDARRGRWREGDSLPLWELRESCKTFAGRFAALGDLPRTGSRALAKANTSPAPAPAGAGPWYLALGAALALAGVGLFTKRSQTS